MLKDTFIITGKVIGLVITFYILDYLFEKTALIIAISVVGIAFVLYEVFFKSDFDYKLSRMCDAEGYLEKIKIKLNNKDESIYNSHLAFAYVYTGDYKNAANAISKVNIESIIGKEGVLVKYYTARLKLAYNNKDLETYSSILKEFSEIKLSSKLQSNFQIHEIPKLLLEKKYQEVVDILLELIPRQDARNVIMELEYYLAVAHIGIKNMDDAEAVLVFVSGKKYNIVYVEKCKELLETL